MKRDIMLFALVAAVAFGSVAVFLGVVSAAANGTVFDVTDPDRGIYNLHHELVKEQP